MRLVGKLTNKKVQSLIGPIRDDENNIILNGVVKTEAMNDYFTAIGPTLASKINSAEGFIDMTHLYKVSPTISQVPFDQDKLLNALAQLIQVRLQILILHPLEIFTF